MGDRFKQIAIISAVIWVNIALLGLTAYVGLRVAGVLPIIQPVNPPDTDQALSKRFAELNLTDEDANYLEALFTALADKIEADGQKPEPAIKTVQQLSSLVRYTGMYTMLSTEYPGLAGIATTVFADYPTSGSVDGPRRADAVARLRKMAEAVNG